MDWNNKENKQLIRAILSLKTTKEAESFLRDLMTEKEIIEFSKRLQTAEMLTKNTPYAVIEQKTGLSSATVARVSKWLNGEQDGYKTIISRLHHHTPIQIGRGLS